MREVADAALVSMEDISRAHTSRSHALVETSEEDDDDDQDGAESRMRSVSSAARLA
jgi:hypothetical protein